MKSVKVGLLLLRPKNYKKKVVKFFLTTDHVFLRKDDANNFANINCLVVFSFNVFTYGHLYALYRGVTM